MVSIQNLSDVSVIGTVKVRMVSRAVLAFGGELRIIRTRANQDYQDEGDLLPHNFSDSPKPSDFQLSSSSHGMETSVFYQLEFKISIWEIQVPVPILP